MQSHYNEYQSEDRSALLHVAASLPEAEGSVSELLATNTPTRFRTYYQGCMEMYAAAETVAHYLSAHQGWFCRCAQPMQVEPIGDNSYVLAIGRFGAFGYDVEPKIALELLPENQGVYRIETVPVPNYVAPGYEANYSALMRLVEAPVNSPKVQDGSIKELTRVEWELNLTVDIHFPKFIHRLPKSVIQTTGDRLLTQIVQQVSRRLTHKVQEDFHKSLGIPFGQGKGKREKGKGKG